MLPGLRFLFAATLMTVSLLIFGMGAIALLRASHQQFASLPPLQPPEPVFAQAPATVPSLSLLRADPAPAALPLAALIQPPREASLTTAERPADTVSPLPQSAAPEPTPEPVPEASAVAVAPDTEASAAPPPDPEAGASAEQPAAASVAIVEPPAQPDQAVDLPVQESPPQTEPASASPQIAAPAPAPAAPETTGSVAPPDPQPVVSIAIADPPLPQSRPELAALSQAAAKAASATVTATEAPRRAPAKRKVRHVKRTAPKVEKLPATTSAPPLSLSSFFIGGG